MYVLAPLKCCLSDSMFGGVDAVEDGLYCQLDSMCTGLLSFLSAEAVRCPLMMGRSPLLNVSVVVFSLVKIREQRA